MASVFIFFSLKRSCTHAALVNAVEKAKTFKSGWWVYLFAKHNTAARLKSLGLGNIEYRQ